MIHCSMCQKDAVAHLQRKTTDGYVTFNLFACAAHRTEVETRMEMTIIQMEKDAGNPFYPGVSKLGFGPLQVLDP